MAATRDVLILGGGHNGLVAAFYLAKAGHKPLVLERRALPGGCAVTEEFFPGFRSSTLAHGGTIRLEIAHDMKLAKHGLHMLEPEPRLFAPALDGRALQLYGDPTTSAANILQFSKKDAGKYPHLQKTLARIAALLDRLLTMTPPDIDNPTAGELMHLLMAGREFRSLGRDDMFRVLRWGPMAIADFVAEWFETDLLRAVIAARGIFGTAMGPWSAGSTAAMLLRAPADGNPIGGAAFPRGGMGALTQAMFAAATSAGAEIRTEAEVAQVLVKDGQVTGVALASGEEISAKIVVSNADPRRTFLKLVDPVHLGPDFVVKMQNYRCNGNLAKINLALDSVPPFTALDGDNGNAAALAGRIHIGPEIDYLERAFDACKYGKFSEHPHLEISIPSLSDPSLAPAGKHVMSIYVQFAPYKLRDTWANQRNALGDAVVKTLAAYAPKLPEMILHRQVITPADLEEHYGLTGGHIFHGELALDQLFTMRPLLGWARYRTPIDGLYLCGNGVHPGTGLTGQSGANAAREIIKSIKR
ncbi:MAG: NAD(P)/FAD-dependent oxidoreductase [Acidobacteria bacterium]|nr:NAD(P)/FAD-dependent oxidoreductase [Acidobacteriota bacterium]MCL5288748.1 NAD(P)/FAD-dependent oxidoreductase [Acidobacteriota bacterium]